MDHSTAIHARTADAGMLATLLEATRTRTLRLLDAYVAALGPSLAVPYSPQLNPPMWEAGHVAWFQEWWIGRNRQRMAGIACDPDHARPASLVAEADALYNSSLVAHAARWHLPLPGLAATRDYLAASLEQSLALLAAETTDDALYFYRLSLFHEDMHGEAAIYMAQALDIDLPHDLRPAQSALPAPAVLALPAQRWRLGHDGAGFAFDNECPAHDVDIAATDIDAVPVSWRRYVEFMEAERVAPPRYLRRGGDGWQMRRYGAWQSLALDAPACHLTWPEGDAWCRWAGRRLPDEAEWETAALTLPGFAWGQVWEWTASRFLPYPGFVAHPYRDYSAPWFGERYVLRGASRATSPRMAHPRYRNYFTPERNDIHMGFRSCAI